MTLMKRRRALMGGAKSSARIPAAYQEVEWVGANNDTSPTNPSMLKISTDFVPTSQNCHIETDVYIIRMASRCGFGMDKNTSPMWALSWVSNYMYYRFGSTSYVRTACSGGVWYHVSCGADFVVDGKKIGTIQSYDMAQNETPLYVFAGEGSRSNARFKEFKVFAGDALVRDMIPCYRKADGKIGFYDVVADVFRHNSGSLNTYYSKGADVT